ncbi:class I SAM-dependent methyltransferase [Leptospira ellisii]|uniref:Class I SAM-dependent methyltransferase n=3 Tax=Leptospira ellisii TaxID=2023197 RepID=A0AAE4TZS0_9LEPT|nr:class I SAM-dependent methyltransferase [Leptospira ellisii]MDV6235836.1 class I SAM-dependent methyltransferase [Leptospira ellisii]
MKKATENQQDVNDYINKMWGDPIIVLEQVFFPYLDLMKGSTIVCEIGVGTGRWSREIIKRMNFDNETKLILVDHSSWVIDFLKNYFREEQRIFPLLNNGNNLPISTDGSVDLIFSDGTFIELKLGQILSLIKEIHRALKPGGIFTFDFIDIDTEEAWRHLHTYCDQFGHCFTYHSADTMIRLFSEVGFSLKNRVQIPKSKSVYLVFEKK